jgi:hypothetical protein
MVHASSPRSAPLDHRNEPNWTEPADDSIDLRELVGRVVQGFPQIVGLCLVGLAIASLAVVALRQLQPPTTATRVSFSFPELERGTYPNKTPFQADDVRAPAVIAEALLRLGLTTSDDLQSRVRGALKIEAIIPPNLQKERDKLRAAGQNPPPFVPDEYTLALDGSRKIPLTRAQREQLLIEIVNVYRKNFRDAHGQPPVAFGTAFETLRNADFPEYELVLTTELEIIRSYLQQKVTNAKTFRSPTTNLSFKDLVDQNELFSRLQLNEVLGLIHLNGLSRSRSIAMLKLDHHLRLLDDRESRALQEERVVRDLLVQAQSGAQNYVLGIKSQAVQNRAASAPLLDRSLVDSLLKNDAYNLLIRRALDAGFEVRRIQAEKVRLLDLRDNMKSFIQDSKEDQSLVIARVQKSLTSLEEAHRRLVSAVRQTHADYADQEYGNAIRLSEEVRTQSIWRPLTKAAAIGAFLGVAIGAALSLLGVYLGRQSRTS